MSPAIFTQTVEVRWSDLDANQHMRHSAYADLCTHARLGWLAQSGFAGGEFARLGLGPVLFQESTEYFREVHLGEALTIDIRLEAASPDYGRWKLRQDMHKADGRLAATHRVAGAWLDLATRKLIAPPTVLAEIFAALTQVDFTPLPQPQYRSA